MGEPKALKHKIEQVFLDLGFQKKEAGGKTFLHYHEVYCLITYLEHYQAFVIESADSYDEAMNGLLEDGDLYYAADSEVAILDAVRKDIKKYYMS